ncbi:MAG: sulfatase-like hydrolase/transferase, partial [Candidatus Latescibacteria bacterium]|nr:sulfatase-like hydrolase/transferase [Candidatus Latescibacterota bacterium]
MARKPNLLFIFTDQQRFDTMRCYGNDFVETPNLNALSESAFVFEHPYVSQPVCTPARSTIMTGLHPHTNGCVNNNIPLREDVPTLAEMVSDDYRCGYFGKWHLGNEVITQHGFDQWMSIEDNYRQYYSKPEYLDILSDYHHFLIRNGFEPDKESHGASV